MTGWFTRTGQSLDGMFELEYKEAALGVSGWILRLPTTHPAVPELTQPNSGIYHTGEPWGEMSGTTYRNDTESRHTIIDSAIDDQAVFYGFNDASWPWFRIMPAPTDGLIINAPLQILLADILLGLDHFPPTLQIDTTAACPVESVRPRYDNVGETFAKLFGDNECFIKSSYNPATSMQVLKPQPANQTEIVATVSNGSVETITRRSSQDEASRIWVLGAYQGFLREFEIVHRGGNGLANGPDQTGFWAFESVIDRSNIVAGNTAALVAAGTAALSLGAPTIEIDLAEADGQVNVGDQIRVVSDLIGVDLDMFVTSRTVVELPDRRSQRLTVGTRMDAETRPV